MQQLIIPGLLWCCAIGCGLLGGLYFAFSAFIMTALDRIDQAAGISAMNAINVDIVRSLFMPLFFGTTLASAVLAIMALFRWGEPGSASMLVGGVVYVVGMFVVTMVFNVPLNNALAAADPSSHGGRAALGALSQGMDLLEPRADGRMHCGVRAVHRCHCIAVGLLCCRTSIDEPAVLQCRRRRPA